MNDALNAEIDVNFITHLDKGGVLHLVKAGRLRVGSTRNGPEPVSRHNLPTWPGKEVYNQTSLAFYAEMLGGHMVSVSTFLRRHNRAGQYELVFGKVRPALHLSERHAAIVQRLHQALENHLAEDNRGAVLTGRVDVVLDYLYGIVLHPPLVVILEQNRKRLRTRTQVRGAPDIVLEVLTRSTARRTRHTRVRWYREWGVRECWLLDTRSNRFEVLGQLQDAPHIFSGEQTIVSSALPEFRLPVDRLLVTPPRPTE